MISKNKKTILIAALACSALVVGGTAIFASSPNLLGASLGEGKTYQLKLNKNKNNYFTYETPKSGTILCSTEEGHNVAMSFTNALKYSDGLMTITGSSGRIYNQGALHGLTSIEFVVDNDMVGFDVDWCEDSTFAPGTVGTSMFYAITAGSSYSTTFNGESPNYFILRSEGDSINISSITLTYTCN